MSEPKRGSDNAGFDVHQTDPARLTAEVKKDLGLEKPKTLDKAKPEWECSQCGYEHYQMKKPRQCPKCGAWGSFKSISGVNYAD